MPRAHTVHLDNPPGLTVSVRCVDCGVPLTPDSPMLLSAATLKQLLDHIYSNDHEIIISARIRP